MPAAMDNGSAGIDRITKRSYFQDWLLLLNGSNDLKTQTYDGRRTDQYNNETLELNNETVANTIASDLEVLRVYCRNNPEPHFSTGTTSSKDTQPPSP